MKEKGKGKVGDCFLTEKLVEQKLGKKAGDEVCFYNEILVLMSQIMFIDTDELNIYVKCLYDLINKTKTIS